MSLEIPIGGQTFQLLKPRDADVLLDEEAFAHDDRLPYWAELWPAARVTAERLASNARRRQRLLEIGCGVGLCSLAAARAGFEVLATDYYPEACEFVLANARRNGLANVASRIVDWRALPDDLGTFDVIVGADVLYERAYGALVAQVVDRLLARDGYALVSDPARTVAQTFPETCRGQGLCVVSQEKFPVEDAGKQLTIDLYTLRR